MPQEHVPDSPEKQKLLNGPALKAPNGVEPDFSMDGNHALGYSLVILAAVFSTSSVLLRLSSTIAMRRIRFEDVLMVCALGLFSGEVYIIYECSIFPGLGLHQWNIQLKHLSRILYYVHLASIFYSLIVLCLKIAILLDLLRLWVPLGQRNWLFWTFHALIWANVLHYSSGTFIEIFRCHPQEKIWNPLYEGGSCPVNVSANNFASGLINIASDVAILVLPQWVIWNLHISRTKRLSISLMFIIGLFACICAIVRLIYLTRMLDSRDVTYYTTFVALTGIGETTVGFLILGIPSIPKVVQSLPFSGSFASLLRTFLRTSNPEPSRPGIFSWPKSASRNRRDQWEISDFDTVDLVTVRTSIVVERDESPPKRAK